MYIGVDVGGTKTLMAVLDDHGVIKERLKFPTSKSYDNFLLELRHAASNFETKDFQAGAIALPGTIDRQHGRGLSFGNLPWKNVNAQHDTEKIFKCPILVENDAKLGALSEAMLLKDRYNKVLYVTVSTGIGYALVADKKIDTNTGDGGGRAIQLEHDGKRMAWEDFASGKAIVRRFGKQAEAIEDRETWHTISRDLAQGLSQLVAILEPDVIVIGGSVGTYFDRYSKLLTQELKKYELPMVVMPDLRSAQRPEEAVVYGCYDLAKQSFHHAKSSYKPKD